MLKLVLSIVVSVVLSVAITIGLVSVHQTEAYRFTTLANENMRMSVRQINGCSGVMVAPFKLLTAAHCATPEYNILAIDEKKDLMLIAVDMDCPCAPLARSEPARDDLVRVVGYPLARGIQYVTEGLLQRLELPDFRHYMAVSAPIIFGNSGGGVFNDRGELIGIASAVMSYATGFDGIPFVVPHLGLAVNYKTIKAFLER